MDVNDVLNNDLKSKILAHAGAVVNLRTLRNKYNSSNRPSKELFEEVMEELEEEGLGEFVQTSNFSAFVKQVPDVHVAEKLTLYRMSIEKYRRTFLRTNFDLPTRLRSPVLAKSSLKETIEE